MQKGPVIICVILIILAVMVPVAYHQITLSKIEQTQFDDRLKTLEVTVKIQEGRIEALLNQYLERIRLIASRTAFRNNVTSLNTETDPVIRDELATRVNDIMSDAAASVPNVKDIHVVDLQGVVISSTNPTFVGQDWTTKYFVANPPQNSLIDELTADENSRLLISLVAPVVNNGEQQGVIQVVSQANELLEITEDRTGLGETGELFIVDEGDSGIRYLTPLRFDHQAALENVEANETVTAIFQGAANGQTGTFSGEDLTDYRGNNVAFITRTIPGVQWGLVGKMNLNELENSSRLTTYTIFIYSGVYISALLVLLFGAWGLSRKPEL